MANYNLIDKTFYLLNYTYNNYKNQYGKIKSKHLLDIISKPTLSVLLMIIILPCNKC